MKKLYFLLSFGLCACASDDASRLVGQWNEMTDGVASLVAGMELKENGEFVPVGTHLSAYNRWKAGDGILILSGAESGTAHDGLVADTFDIVSLQGDTLVLKPFRAGHTMRFVRSDMKTAGAVGQDSLKASRPPYERFVWKEVSGAGLRMLAQQNEHMRVMADPSLPGMVLVRDNDVRPHRLIQIFNTGNRGTKGLLDTLRASKGWIESQTCRFKETDSGRKGVHRYILVPDGEYAKKIDAISGHEPVPVTCSGWGVGNSGMRYFEIYDSNPSKAVFVEIGQDAPIFDETTIELTDTKAGGISKDILYTLEGELRVAHEVRSFVPAGSDKEYWFVDKTGVLLDMYDRVTGGQKNGRPVKAVLKVEYNGKWDDGFAEQYDGVYLVREVISVGTDER